MSPDLNLVLQNLEKASQLSDILQRLKECEAVGGFASSVHFGCSANITVDQFDLTLKKHGYLNQKDVKVTFGAFDSHLENVSLFRRNGVHYPIFFSFFDALLPSLEARASLLSDEMVSELRSKVQAEFEMILETSKDFKMVFLTLFHRMSPQPHFSNPDPVSKLLGGFNEMLIHLAKKYPHACLIDPRPVIERLSLSISFNPRFYYSFKAPYSVSFFDHFARDLFLLIRGADSYFYKVLVLDCDNTLWGGIVGEDHLDGIKLGPYEYPGNVFWKIQNEILALKKSGLLLALCSKNNAADVDEVFNSKSEMVLKDSDITLKKVNWVDKAQNIREIASALNVGLDSIIFLDDSEFECNAVRSQLPQVQTVQVPKNVFEYPKVFHRIKELAYHGNQENSSDKTEQYRIRARALEEQAKFNNQEEYLASLCLKAKIRKNYVVASARIAELSQKSNQFNVTTRRYSQQEIVTLMSSDNCTVYSIEVSDKFGDSGLTGVAIVRYSQGDVEVDSFLMSCRVIGRGIEFSLWRTIFDEARKRGCQQVKAQYIRSSKNGLVENFFDSLGFRAVKETSTLKEYVSPLVDLPMMNQTHLEVNYEC